MASPDLPKPVAKYLATYAEPEAQDVATHVANDTQAFGHALVIPAYGERENVFQTLASVPPSPRGPVLVILVVNAQSDAPSWVHDHNRALLYEVVARWGEGRAVGGDGVIREFDTPQGALWVVDRATHRRFPPKQGVGLARKVGLDMALALRARGCLDSAFLPTTDADALLPADYFSRMESAYEPGVAALLYPFVHDNAGGEASRLYDLFLRYYVRGLAWAGSPYAFMTVGSTVAMDAVAYATVRGFPKRMAGEDFYLLNKAAKVGRVVSLAGEPLVLSGRISTRVPFGTGRSVEKITALLQQGDAYETYAPVVFAHLRGWLAALRNTAASPALSLREAWQQEATRAGLPSTPATQVLDEMNAFAELEKLRAGAANATMAQRRFDEWFDAFRTLKLLHGLRERGFLSVRLEAAMVALHEITQATK